MKSAIFEQASKNEHSLKSLLSQDFDHYVVYPLTERGFASEVNNLCLAVLYALENNIQFHLHSNNWNMAYSKGWADYFEPFCKEIRSPLYSRNITFRKTIKEELSNWYLKYSHPGYIDVFEFWYQMLSSEFLDKKFCIPELGIDGDIFEAKHILMRHIFKLNEETDKKVETLCSWCQKPKISIHVRRGDKVVGAEKEAKIIDVGEYCKLVESLGIGQEPVFIASDDANVLTEFSTYRPELKFESFCTPDREGHDQETFNCQSPDARRDNCISLLADIEMFCQSEVFVGSFSSNIGRLVAALRGDLETSFSVDEDWSPR